MIKHPVSRLAAALALCAVLVGTGTWPAAARPVDPPEGKGIRGTVVFDYSNCPLRRLDRQLVRCDNLTGAGVSAPLFIPEL
jgi:hypothetical protein